MDGTLLISGVTGLLAGYGLLESYVHRRHLAELPIRIHVNGSRGKSAVTRLIAAGLRAGGIRTCAKTTGSQARMILPDASEHPLHRGSHPNVIEQLRVISIAARCGADAVVIECMALEPVLQATSELRLVRSTLGVVTNVRSDHLARMGPSTPDVARALAGTVPIRGKLLTTEQRYLEPFRTAAEDRGSEFVHVDPDEIREVTPSELAGFGYVEHPANVALALRVCRDLGIARNVALGGMWQALPDAGAMTILEFASGEQRIVFVNGFAINDPESFEINWNHVRRGVPGLGRTALIVNCRADRLDRTQQLARSCARCPPADHYLVTGRGAAAFARIAVAVGLSPDRLAVVNPGHPSQVLDVLRTRCPGSALVMGVGNMQGPGMELLSHFRRYGRPWQGGLADALPRAA